MPIIIPLRIMTTIIGLILGYTAGAYTELLYEKQHNYREEVAALLSGIKLGWSEGEQSSDYDDDYISNLCIDCCDSATSTCESEDE